MAALGARVTGVEPARDALAEAEAQGGGPLYRAGTAAATGLEAASADLVLFSMSLHHCPDMGAALDEAVRLLRPGGRLAVQEPEPRDPGWPVARWIDDETEVCAQAQSALSDRLAAGVLEARDTLHYAMRYRVDTAEALIAHMLAVDPARSVTAEGRAAATSAFAEAVQSDEAGRYLPAWIRLDVAAKPL
jgi:ubiquinone/menaquinone biosynthesis C-methylase UbiE